MMDKTAAKDIAEFKAWCELKAPHINGGKGYKGATLVKLLEKVGLERMEATGPKKNGKLELHERVIVKESTNPLNQDECKEYQNQFGNIVEVIPPGAEHQDGALKVKMLVSGSPVVLFEGLDSGKFTGLYRHALTESKGKIPVEVIYFKDPATKTDMSRIKTVEDYIARSKGSDDQRDSSYYVGDASKFAESKEGFIWFALANVAQRSGQYANISEKGTILYVGRLGRRPSGWQKELEEMLKTNT